MYFVFPIIGRDHTMACVPIMKRLAGKLPTVSLGSASRGETAKGQTETTKCRDAKIGKQWSEPIGVGAITVLGTVETPNRNRQAHLVKQSSEA